MGREVRELPYCPRQQFERFHQRTERWACIVAHRRAGKTVCCINDLIYRALTEGKRDGRYAYIAPYYAQAKSIAWDYLLRYSEPARKSANASELWVELLNGARIRLFGGDSPDSLRGLYLDGVILDEYADMRPRVWGEIIRPLLTDRLGWAVFIGTPKGHNAFFDIFKLSQRAEGWYSESMRASQTGLIDAAELLDAHRGMSDDQYEQEFECSFEAAILGAFFGKEMRQAEDELRIGKVPVLRDWPVNTAWDLGHSDDTCIWFYQVAHGEIRVVDFYSMHGQNIEHYADVLATRGYKYGTHWLPHDARAKTLASGGKSTIEQLAEFVGLESLRIVPMLSVQDGIQSVRQMLPRCWFDRDRCEDGIESLKQYQREWNDTAKRFSDRPLHDWTSHAADAFRMMSVAWRDETPRKSKDDAQWAMKSQAGVIQTAPLNELWKTAPRSSGRI